MNNKLAVLAGAPTELQQHLAHLLRAKGVEVVVAVRSNRQADNYTDCRTIQADLSDPGQVKNFATKLKEFGPLHFVVDGFLPGPAPAEPQLVEMPPMQWAEHLRTGLYTSLGLAQSLLPLMNQKGRYLMLHNSVAESNSGMAAVVAAARLKLNKALAAEQETKNVIGYLYQQQLYLENEGIDPLPNWLPAKQLAIQIANALTNERSTDNPITIV